MKISKKLKLSAAVLSLAFGVNLASVAVTQVSAQTLDGVSAQDAQTIKSNIFKNLKKYPNLNLAENDINYIGKTKIPGVFMVAAKNYSVVAYSDISFSSIIVGSYFEGGMFGDVINVSGQLVTKNKKVDPRQLNLQNSITQITGNGSTDIYVVSDPNCDHCNTLNQDILSRLNNVTLHIFPVSVLKPGSPNEILTRSLLCGSPREQYSLWSDVLANKRPNIAAVSCEASGSIERNNAMAKSMGITNYPTVIFPNGYIHSGDIKGEKFVELVNQNSR